MRTTSFQWSLFREAGAQWLTHNPSRLGASLAYYAVLALAPVLVLAVAICGTVFGEAAARGQVYEQIKDVVGPQAAAVAQSVLTAAHKPGAGLLASITGFVVLLFGASGVFSELRDILNLIWDAPSPGPTTVRSFLKYRALSFLMVTAVGIIIMVTLALSTVLEAVGRYITFSPSIAETANAIGSFLVFSLLFAMVYKAIPDVPIDWQDVAFGGVMTAGLFVVGRFFLTLYLSRASVGSPYGAAGSLIVLLVWVYYSSQIFLYGAEFTCVYARRRGSKATKRASMNVEAARSGLRSDAP